MEFRILGPVGLFSAGEQVEVSGQRQRALLAYLLLHANEVVLAERLLGELWTQPPRGGLAALHSQIARLRKHVGDRIVSSGSGYQLRVEEGELDLERFRSLLAQAGATSDPAERSRTLRTAEGLWRGPPLDALDAPFVAAEAAALEELRLAALEDRIEAELELGHHGKLVSELSILVAHYPLRERLRAHLILALYRSGRQADALDAYRETRRVLDEQLGLEPSPFLRELERAILRHDPSLAITSAAPQAAPPSDAHRSRQRAPRVAVAAAVLALAAAATVAVALTGNGHTKLAKPPRRQPVTIADTFNGDQIDGTIWYRHREGSGWNISQHDGHLEFAFPPGTAPRGRWGNFGGHVGTLCRLRGDFDARVDFTLARWPTANGVEAGLWSFLGPTNTGWHVWRSSSARWGEQYGSFTGPAASVSLDDTTGTLRLARRNGIITAYFLHEGHWQSITSGRDPETATIAIGAIGGHGYQTTFGGQPVAVDFDNFTVTADDPICPPGSQPGAVRSTNSTAHPTLADPTDWWTATHPRQLSVARTDDRVTVGMPGSAGDGFNATIETRCKVIGDFDARARFQLLQWPGTDGIWVSLMAADLGGVNTYRSDAFGETYGAYIPPHDGTTVPASGSSGTLRLTRQGNLITGSYLADGSWVTIYKAIGPTTDTAISLAVFNLPDVSPFAGRPATVSFDGFTLAARKLRC
jgi:DNA-binding SARP family transcriptional activator